MVEFELACCKGAFVGTPADARPSPVEVAQVCGGQGIVQGSRVERLFRMPRMYRVLTGTSGIQRNILARERPGGARSQ